MIMWIKLNSVLSMDSLGWYKRQHLVHHIKHVTYSPQTGIMSISSEYEEGCDNRITSGKGNSFE